MDLRQHLRRVVPARTRSRAAMGLVRARELTASARPLPDALVIGAQRCGTSSLYRYLGGHPDVAPSLRKEVEYFTRFFDRGETWYRAHFPMVERGGGRPRLCFEATPDYLLDPRAARRAAATVPDARIVVLLRDPVERAHSQYRHMRRLGLEPLTSFKEALAAEPDRLAGALERLKNEEGPLPAKVHRYSYLTRGRYAEQLERWLSCYPAERVFLVQSEDLFARTHETFQAVLAFLGLSRWRPDAYENHGSGTDAPRRPVSEEAGAYVRETLQDDLSRLETLTGRTFGWRNTVA